MQIIIVGGGEIGYALAKALASDHELCVLDTEPRVADRFGLLDVEFLALLRPEVWQSAHWRTAARR